MQGHDFKYLLVLDFEATCEKDTKLKPCSQIIEFPVLVFDLLKAQVVHEFHYYVKPKFNPVLTPFCTELTGITQQMVNKGLSLQEVLTRFQQFLKQNEIQDFCFVTCGDWDLKTCLSAEAASKDIKIPAYFSRWINIKISFPKDLHKHPKGMTCMLEALGLKLQGRHHSGIDDCRNISRVVRGVIERGWRAKQSQVRKL